MGKYIDVDKLKVLLSDLKENHKQYRGDFHEGVAFAVDEILDDMEESVNSFQAEQSFLPDNLDEAASEYENTLWEEYKDCGYSPLEVLDAFKAGAKWMSEQGVTVNGSIEEISDGNHKTIDIFAQELDDVWTDGDCEVIIQIRKR